MRALETRPWLGPVASAALLALAFQGAWPLLFVALIPWLVSLSAATPRQAWNRGFGFGLLFSLSQLWWLGDLAAKWLGDPFVGAVPWLVASLASAAYYGLLGRLVRSSYLLRTVWAIPLVWAGVEAFRSYVPVLAFPWALVAEPLMSFPPLAGSAWFGTVFLTSAWIVSVNVLLLPGKGRARFALPIAGTLLTLVAAIPTVTKPLAVVAAGQPGVDMAFDPAAESRVGPAVNALTDAAQGLNLLVLPEGLTKGDPQRPPFRVPARLPLVFGGQRDGGEKVYQSAFAHDGLGWTFADKTRLVIFGEFVPGRTIFPFIQSLFRLPGGDLSAGDRLSSVRAGRLKVGPLVCFEALFPDLALRQARTGADVLAVMSIDDWFHPWAKARLARAAQWRAVEAGRPVVRAGTLGRTMIVSDRGTVVADAPYGGTRLVVAGVREGRGPFPLVAAFPALALGSLVTLPLLARRRKAATL